MIFLSEEDIDVTSLVTSWITAQDAEVQSLLTKWMDTWFYKVLEWSEDREQVVATTKVGVVTNALSHLRNADNKKLFMIGLMRGFGANLSPNDRTKLASKVSGW